MAEFLVLSTDAPGYAIGDILHVAEDDASWGGMECLEPGDGSSFLVVRMDMTLIDAQAYCVPLYDSDGNETSPHRYRVDINSYLTYDELAHLCVVEWEVPTLPVSSIIDKGAVV